MTSPKPFLYSAFYNWLVTPTLLLFVCLEGWMGLPEPAFDEWGHMFLGLVLVFGYGYYRVYKKPMENITVIHMGIIGKTIVFLTALAHFITADLHPIIMLAATVDGVFAVLFLLYLLNLNKELA